MNKLAYKMLWWQSAVLTALALVQYIAGLTGLWRKPIINGYFAAYYIGFAALSMALSRTRLCGLSPWLSVLSSFGLGLGFLIIMIYFSLGGSPYVGLIGPQLIFVAFAIMTGGVADCKQEASKRIDKPLRIISMLLSMYILARILMRVMTMTWFSWGNELEMTGAVYEIILIYLSAVGIMLSLRALRLKTSAVFSIITAVAFVAGAIFLARALSDGFILGSSGNVLLETALGIVLLFPSFLRRFSNKVS